MDVKSTWIPAWHRNGSCFMGTWIIFQKPSLEGRPHTKPGNHGILNAHNCWFILLYHVWGPTWIKIHRNSIWLRALSHMTSLYTWESVTTVHGFGGARDGLWTLSFGLSQFHGHGSLLVCGSGPRYMKKTLWYFIKTLISMRTILYTWQLYIVLWS
jgi:hypothetical protein